MLRIRTDYRITAVIFGALACGTLISGCGNGGDEGADTATGGATTATGNTATGQQSPRVGSPSPIKGEPGAFNRLQKGGQAPPASRGTAK